MTNTIHQAVPGRLYLHIWDEVMDSHSLLLFPKQFKAHTTAWTSENCSTYSNRILQSLIYCKMSYQSHYKEQIKTFFTRGTQTWDKTITFREHRHNHLWMSVMVISTHTLRSYSSWMRTSWFVWQSPESVRSKPVVSFSCSPPICHEQQLLN